MPYKTTQEATKDNKGLEKYSEKAKRGWLGSFNQCSADGGPEDKCFAIAYSVANKVDGRKPGSKKSSRELSASDRQMIARELLAVAREIEAISFSEEAKSLKMKAVVEDFMDDVKHFKGDINRFLKQITSMVENPRALAEFPELKDVVELSKYMKKGVLRHTFMSPAEISERMRSVVEMDA